MPLLRSIPHPLLTMPRPITQLSGLLAVLSNLFVATAALDMADQIMRGLMDKQKSSRPAQSARGEGSGDLQNSMLRLLLAHDQQLRELNSTAFYLVTVTDPLWKKALEDTRNAWQEVYATRGSTQEKPSKAAKGATGDAVSSGSSLALRAALFSRLTLLLCAEAEANKASLQQPFTELNQLRGFTADQWHHVLAVGKYVYKKVIDDKPIVLMVGLTQHPEATVLQALLHGLMSSPFTTKLTVSTPSSTSRDGPIAKQLRGALKKPSS
eukprot:6473436-Amphidinium_carterae.1